MIVNSPISVEEIEPILQTLSTDLLSNLIIYHCSYLLLSSSIQTL